jgi:hypothetical protein
MAWWVDRRRPGRNDPEIVGKNIGKLYETIYGYRHPGFTKAGLLRAEAAHIRDQGEDECDWEKVHSVLLLFYQALQEGIENELPHPSGAG